MTQGTAKETERLPSESSNYKAKKRGLSWLLFAGGALFIGLAVVGIYSRNIWTTELQRRTDEAARTIVHVVHPERAVTTIPVQLPGQTMAYTDAPIFAQTSGYLKKWYFDIGAEVKAGDVLAEIDTPEVDQQLAQAQAQLRVAQSARDLSEVTYKRSQDLYQRNVIAALDFETATDNYRGNQSTVIADQANVNRLEALEAFKIVRAPFNGFVTARNTDIGAYVAAGSGTQLFRIAQISPLRVYINVPQAFSPFVKVGIQGDLTLDQFPDRKFPGHVVGTAGAINPTAKTLLTELQVPNETGELPSGAYGQITLRFRDDADKLTVPANTLLFRSGGPAVGVVHPDGTVEIRKISISRDLGEKLEISQGLSESDQVIVNPSDSLADGTTVTNGAAVP